MKILSLFFLIIFAALFVESSFAYRLILVSTRDHFPWNINASGLSVRSCNPVTHNNVRYFGRVLQQSSGMLDQRRITIGNCQATVSRVRNNFNIGNSNCSQNVTSGKVVRVADFSNPNVRDLRICQ